MTKAEFVESLASSLGQTKSEGERALEAVVEVIKKALERGEKIDLRGLGIFKVRESKARTARNPRTGEPIAIPAKKAAIFKPGKERSAVQAGGNARPLTSVKVGVRAGLSRCVRMLVRGNQVDPLKQGNIVENLECRGYFHDLSLLKHKAAIGNLFEVPQIVRRGDDGLLAAAPGSEQIHDLPVAFRVESARRFVKQQHFRVQHQHRGDCDALFLAAG